MARAVNRLSPVAVPHKGPGFHADGQGLYLQVKNGGRSWLFRYSINEKARWMGLGAFPDVTLAEARKAAGRCRELLRAGVDPIEARRAEKAAARAAAARSVTFREAAERYIGAHKAGWRNEKHGAQWTSTLETFVYPIFGKLPVQEVDTGLVLKALEPIWTQKHETATRVRQRIEAVLNWATAGELRTGENPARWSGHLENRLPKPKQIRRVNPVKHHEAMPYEALPAFWQDLRQRETISAKALAFTILTAARSGETRGARLGEIDFASNVWTVPGERTKSGDDHRVPLTKEALAILTGLDHLKDAEADVLLFPNSQGKPLSDTAMRKYLQSDMGRLGLTVHGFRSSFREWAAEETNFPWWVAEAAIAHKNGTKTERAYQRRDLLDRRRKLMEAWSRYCVAGTMRASAKVVPLSSAG
ncbi:tyrosine-type recombinase/integrase [Pelagibius sp.]|uniref:tyrosine-type recombinase/integrase n=1 Tax=Pelagibius sp. TaxID=1931238 RepID=UPI003BAF0177